MESRNPGENYHYIHTELRIAAETGDWKKAKSYIECNPGSSVAPITFQSRTVLHVAAICCQWEFILKFLELLTPESIQQRDKYENTVLHYVAEGGNLETAKALVRKNRNLPQMGNCRQELPLHASIILGENKKMVQYLSLVTNLCCSSFINSLPMLLRKLIQLGYHDKALYFVQTYPSLLLYDDDHESAANLLLWLAYEPSHFFSGNSLGIFKSWIHESLLEEYILESTEGFPSLKPRSFATQDSQIGLDIPMLEGFKSYKVLRWFKRLLWKAIAQLIPSTKMVLDVKLKHECAVELVNLVCKQLSPMSFEDIDFILQNPQPILGFAVINGIEEIVRALLKHFPDLLDYDVLPQLNILQAAIKYRQEKIVNVIKEISPTATKYLCYKNFVFEDTTLHLVARLPSPSKFFSVPGTALQIQRELQWFKEVEKLSVSAQRKWKNENGDTAIDVFRIERKELAEQGEKWMKNTANSCMLVSTLIATVLFAAAFTVPGGNTEDRGIPIYLHTKTFMVFALSEAVGLFFSLTSLLMFLAILTSRYAIEDFHVSLPQKLIIGLGSLFISIAAMISAFGATLVIMLSERWQWAFVPIIVLASIPVALFVRLQLMLFIQMVMSTHGRSIFGP